MNWSRGLKKITIFVESFLTKATCVRMSKFCTASTVLSASFHLHLKSVIYLIIRSYHEIDGDWNGWNSYQRTGFYTSG